MNVKPKRGQIIEYRSGGGSKGSPQALAHLTADTLNCYGHMPGYAETFEHNGASFVVSGDYMAEYEKAVGTVGLHAAAEQIAAQKHRLEVLA